MTFSFAFNGIQEDARGAWRNTRPGGIRTVCVGKEKNMYLLIFIVSFFYHLLIKDNDW